MIRNAQMELSVIQLKDDHFCGEQFISNLVFIQFSTRCSASLSVSSALDHRLKMGLRSRRVHGKKIHGDVM